MMLTFAIFSGFHAFEALIFPPSVGSHAGNYTVAAAAWQAGEDPWLTGPPAAIFAGPPPMLLPFVPFVGLPYDLTRLIWVVGSLILAVWSLRRLRLPGYWLVFPPMFQAIMLGHPEVLVLWLLIVGGPLSGLGGLIKPYAGFALLAERRWSAIVIAGIVLVLTAPLLPWQYFISDLSKITANLGAQSHGDSVFGSPILMAVAAIALLSLGLRRGLWLAAPLLWPSAQPIYKVTTVPRLSPVLAIAWSIPIPGATLIGLVIEASLTALGRFRRLPPWLDAGIGPLSNWPTPLMRIPA